MAGYCDRCIKEKVKDASSGLFWAGDERVCGDHLEKLHAELEEKNKKLDKRVKELEKESMDMNGEINKFRDENYQQNEIIGMGETRMRELDQMVASIRDEAASVISLNDSSDYLPSLWVIFRKCGYENDELERVAKDYFERLEREQGHGKD